MSEYVCLDYRDKAHQHRKSVGSYVTNSWWMFWTVRQRDCLYCWSWNNTVPVNASFALPTILISASSVSCTASLGVFWEASGDHSWPGSTRHYCCSLWGARGHTQVKCVRSIMQRTVLCSLWTVQSCTLLSSRLLGNYEQAINCMEHRLNMARSEQKLAFHIMYYIIGLCMSLCDETVFN